MNQMERLKEYIEQLQREAFEEGFKIASEQGQRHGHWVKDEDGLYHCSNCGLVWELSNDGTPEENEMHYCPKCGAKMDESKRYIPIYDRLNGTNIVGFEEV